MALAIIAILAGILLPTLSRAKTLASSAKCKSNLRQLSLALRFYLDDFHAYPPFPLSAGVTSGSYLWNAVGDYLQKGLEVDGRGYTNAAGVFQCPSPAATIKLYGVNMGGIGDDFLSGRGLAGRAVYESFSLKEVQPTTESSVKAPAALIALGDSLIGFTNGVIASAFSGMIARSSSKVGPFTEQEIAATIRTHSRRHGGFANVSFGDGHVDGMKFQPLFFDETDEALRRWHVDNEPHREVIGKKR